MTYSNSEKYKPIIFISGKGGVGKSVVSASLAYHLSQRGKKVLLVELGEKSFFEKFFQTSDSPIQIGYHPYEITPNLFLSIWDFKAVLKEYVSFYIKSEKLYELFFGNKIMQKFIQAAPALKELAILGKATSGPREVGPKLDFDHIIIDSYSTGHHRALLKAPKGISQVIRKGPMGNHSEAMLKVIQDPDQFQQIIVIRPEELPTIEGLELKESLKKDLNIESLIVCNQILESPITQEELNEEMQDATGEMKKMVEYFSTIFSEQRACLATIEKKARDYIPMKFFLNNSNKFKFIAELSKSF